MLRQPHPAVRFGAGAAAMLGALICADLLLLGASFLAVVGLSFISGVTRRFLRFVAVVMLPFGVALVVVWVGLMGAPPGSPMGTDRSGALEYALLIVLRLAVCSGLFQVVLLSVASEELMATLRLIRLPDNITVMVLSTLAIIPELTLRADQVLTARLARGLFGKPTLRNRVTQVPRILGPLVCWTLRSALQRAEIWEHRDLIGRLRSLPCTVRYSAVSSLLSALLTAVFLGLAIRTRF